MASLTKVARLRRQRTRGRLGGFYRYRATEVLRATRRASISILALHGQGQSLDGTEREADRCHGAAPSAKTLVSLARRRGPTIFKD